MTELDLGCPSIIEPVAIEGTRKIELSVKQPSKDDNGIRCDRSNRDRDGIHERSRNCNERLRQWRKRYRVKTENVPSENAVNIERDEEV